MVLPAFYSLRAGSFLFGGGGGCGVRVCCGLLNSSLTAKQKTSTLRTLATTTFKSAICKLIKLGSKTPEAGGHPGPKCPDSGTIEPMPLR